MTHALIELRRSGWDIVLGILLTIVGLVVLINAAIATTVSVLFLGWMLLIAGIVGLAAAFFLIGKGGFWSAALTGILLGVLGLFFLRNTEAAIVTLTLIAGVVFLVSGIGRLMLATEVSEYRWAHIFAGGVSTVLGLIVLFNLFTASTVLLGILLGVQVLMDGITMMLVGRVRVHTVAPGPAPAH